MENITDLVDAKLGFAGFMDPSEAHAMFFGSDEEATSLLKFQNSVEIRFDIESAPGCLMTGSSKPFLNWTPDTDREKRV
ncbi:hypothetical protein E1B28_003098 [Marasmius oreades]|uniref:Uncharacterized protein n=1 Tax=Marasmius oreades TaxID=181124 RepID=A0A9P7RLU9_9AGAR|nr:uncharacterized protein E1B28_003098 [Marasmius oreades]KAG7085540.1 hypothetical protein E1B28_003098 [Marasmius oreades]